MKLFKTTSLLSYLIILSLIFTSVLPAFANEDIQVAPVEEAISDTDDTANEIIPEEYSPDNHDSIAYDSSKYESPEEIPLPDDGENDVDDTVTLFGEEEEEVKLDDFKQLWNEMRMELQDNDKSDYSAEARDWAIKTELVKGGAALPDGKPNYMWEDVMTREQFVTVLYRFAQMMGKA